MQRIVILGLVLAGCGRGSGGSSDVLGNLKEPNDVIADASGVYVADGDRLVRWNDGERTTLFHGARVDNLAVDDDAVYYVTYDETKMQAQIRRVAKQGGAATVLATDWPLVDVEVDGGFVYWSSLGIHRVAKTGGTPETIVPAESVALGSDLALADHHVYFLGKDAIARVSDAGGPVEALFPTDADHAAGPIVHDGVVWWTEHDWKALKRAKVGGAFETIALTPSAFVAGLAWSERGMLVLDSTGRRLVRVDAAGKVTLLQHFDRTPRKLAAFGDAVYVGFDRTDAASASIRRY